VTGVPRLCHDRIVRSRLSRVAASVVGRRTRLRWVYQILGGALLMPYFFLAVVVLQIVNPPRYTTSAILEEFAGYFLALPIVAVTAFAPQVRVLELAAVPALLGTPATELSAGPAASWSARWRTAVWYLLHLAVGGLVSGMSLAVPPVALLLLVLPLVYGRPRDVADQDASPRTGPRSTATTRPCASVCRPSSATSTSPPAPPPHRQRLVDPVPASRQRWPGARRVTARTGRGGFDGSDFLAGRWLGAGRGSHHPVQGLPRGAFMRHDPFVRPPDGTEMCRR
jgi:hypothetical protein